MFTGARGSCHAADAPMTRDGAPSFGLGIAVDAPNPDGGILAIVNGVPCRDIGSSGHQAAYMPAYAQALTDAQAAALAGYVRA